MQELEEFERRKNEGHSRRRGRAAKGTPELQGDLGRFGQSDASTSRVGDKVASTTMSAVKVPHETSRHSRRVENLEFLRQRLMSTSVPPCARRSHRPKLQLSQRRVTSATRFDEGDARDA